MTAPPSTAPDWDPARYAQEARFVADFGQALVPLLQLQPDERILDVGCGDGVLTQELAKHGCRVVGVDASPRQVEAARRRGVTALVCDGHSLPFHHEFDAVFSNAALHWMQRPDDALAGIARALKPGGRFVAEFGGHGNVGTICNALRDALQRRGHSFDKLNPWYFPTDAEYQAKLTRAGFEVRWLQSFPRPTPLPGNIIGWLETFAQSFTIGWSPAERTSLFAEVRDTCRPTLCDADGRWTADYVRLRFVAVRR
ncbi:MAG TPA: class I SAM-dependent methyltransferase [Planctomycetaceae bacterium]|nr:class I SAM-dependent methyltransferase [Planctomycetaceae bacterium]